jgi:hypothetical protein
MNNIFFIREKSLVSEMEKKGEDLMNVTSIAQKNQLAARLLFEKAPESTCN